MARANLLMALTLTMVSLASFGFAQDKVYSSYQFRVPTGFLRKYTAKVSVERKGSGGVLGKSAVSFDYTATFTLKVEKPSKDRSAKELLTPPRLHETGIKQAQGGDDGGNRGNVANAANRQVDLLFINNAVKMHKAEITTDWHKSSPSHSIANEVSRFPDMRVTVNQLGKVSDPPRKEWVGHLLQTNFHRIVIPALVVPRAGEENLRGVNPLRWSTINSKGIVLRLATDEYFRMHYAVAAVSGKSYDIIGWDDIKKNFVNDDLVIEAVRQQGQELFKTYRINMRKRLWAQCDRETGAVRTLVYTFFMKDALNGDETNLINILVLVNRNTPEIPESARKRLEALKKASMKP